MKHSNSDNMTEMHFKFKINQLIIQNSSSPDTLFNGLAKIGGIMGLLKILTFGLNFLHL